MSEQILEAAATYIFCAIAYATFIVLFISFRGAK